MKAVITEVQECDNVFCDSVLCSCGSEAIRSITDNPYFKEDVMHYECRECGKITEK